MESKVETGVIKAYIRTDTNNMLLAYMYDYGRGHLG